jgi:hypothetical protein
MASYFELFATGLRGCTVRWTRYEDAVAAARGDTVILYCRWLSLAAIASGFTL